MKMSKTQPVKRATALTAVLFSSLMLASCVTPPDSPEGAEQARSALTALQNDPNLADRARVEIRRAEAAVRTAEQPLPETNTALGRHRVYMADQAVAIAKAKATTRYTEAQREKLAEQRNEARLEARSRQVGQARNEAEQARRAEAQASAASAQQAAEYRRQIDELQAEVTDRGLVLTLGDVLFATNSAELQSRANSNLDKLVGFLKEYPERRVQIEGHTDNVGSVQYNQDLSQRRANSVRDYLTQHGIASQRLSTAGMGMGQPVASNDSSAGRQQNRRVEIIIENPKNPKRNQ